MEYENPTNVLDKIGVGYTTNYKSNKSCIVCAYSEKHYDNRLYCNKNIQPYRKREFPSAVHPRGTCNFFQEKELPV